MSLKRGVSLIEFIISLAILAMIAWPLFYGIKSTLSVWQSGTSELESTQNLHYYLSPLTDRVRYCQSVSSVSLSSELYGHIQYIDTFNRQFTLFLNTKSNQVLFSRVNNFPLTSLVFASSDVSDPVELLLQNVLTFSVETYKEDASIFPSVTLNNTVVSSYDGLNSLKFIVTITDDSGKEQVLEQLVDIARTSVADSDSVTYGTNALPFSSFLNDSTVTNISSSLDGKDSYSDMLHLSDRSETVTIAHSGVYFSTIQDALEQSVSGDVVLVAYKENGYRENLFIPHGVRLEGGYNPLTWERHPEQYPAIITPKEGISLGSGITTVVRLSSQSAFDGFTIDANHLNYGIYAKDVSAVSIQNTFISNCEIPLFLDSVSGEIVQNHVTANTMSCIIENSSSLLLARNHFFSKNYILNENVLISNSSNLRLLNNIFDNGYTGLSLTSITNLVVAHNIFTNAQNFGLSLSTLNNADIYNNGFFKNNIGLLLSASSPGTFTTDNLHHNFFSTNLFGHALNVVLNTVDNIITSPLSDYDWQYNNPYLSAKTFELFSDSLLIDQGDLSEETYINANPSWGLSVNDIGLYGGAYAGRVGPAKTQTISDLLTGSAIQARVTNVFPGDHLLFGAGTFTLTSPIIVKPYQRVSGINVHRTQLVHSAASGSPLIQMGSSSILQNLSIDAEEKTAVQVSGVANASVSGLLIYDSSTGIYINNAHCDPAFCTIYDGTTGILFSSSASGSVSYCVLDNLFTGLKNLSLDTLSSKYTVFNAVSTDYSGTFLIDTNISGDVLRDPSSGLFYLKPTANAVNISSHYDAGAVAFIDYIGRVTFPVLDSSINRRYSSLSLQFLHPLDTESFFSDVSIILSDGAVTSTLNTVLSIADDSVDSFEFNLPYSVISDSLELTLQVSSYSFNRTPYIDSVLLQW